MSEQSLIASRYVSIIADNIRLSTRNLMIAGICLLFLHRLLCGAQHKYDRNYSLQPDYENSVSI